MKMENGITYGNQMMETPSQILSVKHSAVCSTQRKCMLNSLMRFDPM